MRRSAVVAVVLVVSVGSLAGVAAAQSGTGSYGGEPELDVLAPSPTVVPGERASLTLQVANDGAVTTGVPPAREAVTTARSVELEADADGTPLTVRSGRQAVGSVTESRPKSATVALEVPDDIEPGSYELDVELAYSYTDRVFPFYERTSERTETITRTVDVVVESGPRFEARTVETDVGVGGAGTATVAVTNVGDEPADGVAVTVESGSRQVTVGGASSARAAVGRVGAGETATTRYDVAVADDVTVRAFPMSATVTYDDADGLAGTEGDLSLALIPRSEASVAVDDVESSLRVSEEGELRVTVRNDGPTALSNAVVRLRPPSSNVEVIEPEVAVGDLEAGASTTVGFDVETADAARAGSRQFALETEYEADGTQSVNSVKFDVAVREGRDAFAVEARNATVTAGGDARVVLAVTNQRDERVTDVSAKLFASSPLSADDDEAYVAALDSGETVTVPFRVSSGGNALAKDYPVAVDFQYVDAGGETRLSESYRRPVTVEQGDGGPLSVVPLGAVAVVALLAPAAALLRRR